VAAITQSGRAKRIKQGAPITCLFLDIGDVLLTDGWDHNARGRAAAAFKLDLAEINERHHLTFETFEDGKLTLEQYLSLVVFYRKRPFTRAQFQRFIFAQSKACPGMIGMLAHLKLRHSLKVIALSNEARELNAYRIRKFRLNALMDAYVSSCFVQIRKPDEAIFRLALDIAQTPIGQILYIDNTPMFVQIAESLGIKSILHTGIESTRDKLAVLGLRFDEETSHAIR
jgi:putative hydrolase of the HAD superfamily